jgi:hypothetical protein
LATVSPTHTAFVRTDAEWLRYVDDVPGIGYDYNRLRSRVGWRWQSADFDFVEVAAGIGRRAVPDSTEREYAERFATFYSDIGAGDRHRLSLDLHIDAKDYKSNDPRDDYTFSAAEARWDYRPRLSWLLSAWVRWDFWDFRAEDEVTSDFHEIEPTVEAKIPLGTSWAARLGMRYRAMFSPNSESLQANYGQPSAICGLEYMPFVPVWTDLRAEIGYRDYEEGVLGYSDFTLVKIDLSGTADIADRWSFLAAVNYEIEVHAVEQDDTDFLYFSFRLAYHLMR